MEGWGLSFTEVLAPRFPKRVHCRISGFGAEGPLGGLPGYDAVLQAMTGLMSVNGDPSMGPMRVGTPIVDLSTGLYAVIGILMALQERVRSGLGQFVDMALYDCGMSLLHPHAANYFLSGKRPIPLGNSHPNVVSCDKFKTRDGEVFVVVGNESQFRKLAKLLGMPELATDPRFATNSARTENRPAPAQALQGAFADQQAMEISGRLLEAGVPVGPVLQIDESLGAGHTRQPPDGGRERQLLRGGDPHQTVQNARLRAADSAEVCTGQCGSSPKPRLRRRIYWQTARAGHLAGQGEISRFAGSYRTLYWRGALRPDDQGTETYRPGSPSLIHHRVAGASPLSPFAPAFGPARR